MTLRLRVLAVAATAMVAAALLTGTAEPAAAATANRFGFALVDNPTVPAWTTLNPAYQYGSWAPGPLANGGKVALGRFYVRFPNVAAGASGNVHVTAVAADGRFCETVRWGSSGLDELIDVACFKPGGAPADTPFTVLWTTSSGILPAGVGSYASVQVSSTAVVVQSYDSTGAAVTVSGLSTGIYGVRFPGAGLAGALSGNVQVTALQPNAQARRCKILRWGVSGTDVIVYVACFDPATGTPVNSDFTASFARERSVYASFAPPKYFGYLATPFPGTATNYSYPLGVGPNGWGGGAGSYTVKFPLLHQKETTSQVTAIGDGPDYCTIRSLWINASGDAVVPVVCFTNAGALDKSDFSIAFASSV